MRLFFLLLPLILIFQGCSYLDAVKRSKTNEEIKGTKAYYDNKCLVAEECASLSGSVYLPVNDISDTLALVTVIQDGNESRAIDAQLLDFTTTSDDKVAHFFFSLPVGDYMFYVIKADDNKTLLDDELQVLAEMGPGSIGPEDLKEYHNAYITKDIKVDSDVSNGTFAYSIDHLRQELIAKNSRTTGGYFDDNVDLDDPIFSHKMAMEGLYYPQNFKTQVKPLYRLAPEFKKGTIPIVFVHGMSGTPRDWRYMVENLDLERYTPYLAYYPTGEDYTKLSVLFSGWILSDKLFEDLPIVIVAHSFGGVIVRDALNLEHDKHKLLFISLASPYGGDAKASDGVKNAPYVLPAWRSIADDGDFIENLYRKELSENETFKLIFAYNNYEEGPSGDSRIPLRKQLRFEAQEEADELYGFDEDHVSILKSKKTAVYIDELLNKFADENLK
ncbi:MAG: hypothetical protein ABFR02_07700 [Campylobacterota bacterium]